MEFRIPRISLSSESCSDSENTPELSESSENDLFTPRAFFPEIGVVPRLSDLRLVLGDNLQKTVQFIVVLQGIC